MSKRPPFLKTGDTIGILCTARYVNMEQIQPAIKLFESWGLRVKLGDSIGAEWNIFGGDDELRAKNLSDFFVDAEIKAIVCARGGYGTLRMIDKVDFSALDRNPKWLIGFSDVTALHAHINTCLNMPSIHGQMALNIENKSAEAHETLRKALFGEALSFSYQNDFDFTRHGTAEGELVGGNLALIYAVQGSVSELDTDGKILFLEEVEEWLYNVDRMLWNLKRSGKLDNLKGLIIGGFSQLLDNDIPFGMTYEEIIWEKVKDYDYPVCFNFPSGHIDDNRALILGSKVKLEVGEDVSLRFTTQ
ncbi:S66 peptidase family protein [Solitalea koreensis]|uniref:Muramoyltetrapeptide carboxypeptidase n=1 Tax=Solitalea koreensis TaxID=543615 RepID=A0A521CBQ7_9SPHI|nr:LD-carboxypeptidase [Solitalea koreensis]SMO56241.1 muramoyltetrapeptide carboxypeptidase [Solitalea koreensis]